MLNHYILIRYNSDTSETHIEEFIRRMYALKKVIPEIIELNIARDILREERNWDLMLIMKFESVDSLRIYQKHENHQAVMRYNSSQVQDVAAFDYEQAEQNPD